MLPILITGISGRMGQAVQQAVEQTAGTFPVGTHDTGQDIVEAINPARCVIDFSHHSFTRELLAAAVATGTPLVIGTTGHSDEERQAIVDASRLIPIVYASNFSVGVNALFWLTRRAARMLDDNFDVEVLEMHHRHKIDSPSGTARRLLEILCEEKGLSLNADVTHGREGIIGPRPSAQIGMHTLRGGDVVGDHTVMFAADGERVELTHKASSRQTFARGAVKAALWLQGMPVGLYDMEDVLGLSGQ